MKGYRAKSGMPTINGTSVKFPDGRNLFTGSSGRDAPGAEEVRRSRPGSARGSGTSAARRSPKRQRPDIPRGTDGKPDFSGIWQSLSGADYGLEPHLATKDGPPGAGVVEGNVIPVSAGGARAAREKFRRARYSRSANQVLYARNPARDLQQ